MSFISCGYFFKYFFYLNDIFFIFLNLFFKSKYQNNLKTFKKNNNMKQKIIFFKKNFALQVQMVPK
jgi:hypothetical protein